MVIAPVFVLVGAAAVVALSTPVMFALMVIAFASAILFAASLVTRQTPAPDTAVPGQPAPGRSDPGRSRMEGPMCESIDLIPAREPGTGEQEKVEMVEALAFGPGTAVTAVVTKVFGPCSLGLMPGNTWRIGPEGGLSRPMCRYGATALGALFKTAGGGAMSRSVCCECFTAGREVIFTVREAAGEAV